MDINLGEAVKELRESLTSPAIWAFVFASCLVVLLLPPEPAATLRIVRLREEHGALLGFAVIVSGVGLVISLGRLIANVWHGARLRAARRGALRSLSPEEKAALTRFIRGNTKSAHFDVHDPVARGLVAQGILVVPSPTYDITVGVSHHIQPWAWEHLRKRPELLNLTQQEYAQLEERARTSRRRV